MAITYLQYLPILLGGLAVISFFTSYGMAVHEKHVDALFPYISDAGARPPESCIFGQFLNMAAVIAFVAMYLHYKHIKEFNITQTPIIQKLNMFSLWLSAFACLGMSMVANFQYINSEAPHFVGAFMVFCLGIAYCWIQSYITYKMRAQGMSSTLALVTRFFLSFAATVFFLITIIAAAVASSEYKKRKVPTPTPVVSTTPHMKWNKSDPGYKNHLASTFGEWLMAISFLLFFLTYYREFKKIVITIKVAPKDSEIFFPTEDNSGAVVA
ncbi:DNA damage-regulated autophagy modulator protein 2-like isoform X2 [Actinia tenebrosa]|nr:DNA damage-regulated autophagy modulator protein 2-like isoform X2 [Actinia tenebrosa]